MTDEVPVSDLLRWVHTLACDYPGNSYPDGAHAPACNTARLLAADQRALSDAAPSAEPTTVRGLRGQVARLEKDLGHARSALAAMAGRIDEARAALEPPEVPF